MHSVTNTIHPPQITQQSGVAVSHTCSGQPGCLQAAAGIDGFGSRASGSCPLRVQEMCTANVTLGCLSSAFLQTLGAHEISAPTQSWSICASCQHREAEGGSPPLLTFIQATFLLLHCMTTLWAGHWNNSAQIVCGGDIILTWCFLAVSARFSIAAAGGMGSCASKIWKCCNSDP